MCGVEMDFKSARVTTRADSLAMMLSTNKREDNEAIQIAESPLRLPKPEQLLSRLVFSPARGTR